LHGKVSIGAKLGTGVVTEVGESGQVGLRSKRTWYNRVSILQEMRLSRAK